MTNKSLIAAVMLCRRLYAALARNVAAWLRSFARDDAETAFLPAALEIIETPASPAGRATAGLIMAFFLIALLWACLGSVDIIATAQGKIVPTGRSKMIQPLETGVVHAIHVQDGQQVKAGDVLIEIDSTITESERDRLQKEWLAAKLESTRLAAAVNIDAADPAANFAAPDEATAQQRDLQRALLVSQVEEIRAKLAALDRQIAQNEGNKAAVTATIAKLTQSIPMLKERSKMRGYLSDKGYGSKLETLTAQQDLVEHEQELQVQQGRLAEATAAIAALQQQRLQAEAEYRHTTLNALTQAEQKASSLQEQSAQAAQKYRLQTLTAPVDGTVQQLAVHTEGGVVTPAQALLVLVPADSQLEIEAMVSNRDIGFVHDGQEAQVKIDTFNFTKYGLLRGTVKSISQDAVTMDRPADNNTSKKQIGAESESSEPKGQELVYIARIALRETQMQIDDRLVNLTPGMAVTAEIKTGTRHVIDYLLSPLLRAKHQALRER